MDDARVGEAAGSGGTREISADAKLLGAGVMRREARLADGRELYYYDDPGSHLPAERHVDLRTLEARPETASMRFDVLLGDWVSFATTRQNRVVMPPAELDPLAPQSANNPSEIPSHYDVVVFENRSPAFGPEVSVISDPAQVAGPDDLAAERTMAPTDIGLGRSRPAVGRCEVVCFSPEAQGSFGTQSVVRARTVIEAWADRTAALSELPGVEQVFPFENRGIEIGVTLPHPHGQIYGYPYVTPRTERVLESVGRAGGDFFERILDFERDSDRIVLSGEYWTAFVPYAARWPLEVQLFPHRQLPDFAETEPDERDELARLYLRLLRGVDALYETPTPYIAAWHQAPLGKGRDEWRLHLSLTSPRRGADKLKYLAGSEAAMGAWVADVAPEHTAAKLREAIATVPEVVFEDAQ